MEWKNDHQPSSHILHSSKYSFFTQQAPPPAYMGPGSERANYQHSQYHHQKQLYPRSDELHKAIQREIEKEWIREEIILSEIMRRRTLEDEVRRELIMMESGLALRRCNNAFPFGSSPVTGSPLRVPVMETRAAGRSTGRCEGGGFQRGTFHLRISKDENTSGSKRKVATPPWRPEFRPDGMLRKKAKEEWSCALCQVSATTELPVNQHLHGNKHKSKEAAFIPQMAAKNYSYLNDNFCSNTMWKC
ncbi:hypothetical protein Salat_2625700 [Sesamum alatum]|uniref:U1-type domain-containing protein n=1 Tax=Sesamum alatum TaxID=300844 RepID=A0AAE1XNM3_9LAMI|nr:hypothetical protein Salat_2625700 [Sesamum alatum]